VQSEKWVDSLIDDLNQNGKNCSKRVEEIPDFPFENFSAFHNGVKSRQARLRRHSDSMEASIFIAIADRNEKALHSIGQVFSLTSLPLGLILAFLVSWWYLVLAFFLYFLGMKIISDIYNKAVFRSAMTNEKSLCLLYYCHQISIEMTHDNSIHCYQGV
jgi:hypothetical protein